jgi:LacI family transcriptional regulator
VIYLSTAALSLGGVRSLSARKVRVPHDISLVVAGNSPWYEIWPGGLTSVSLPMAELTDTASALVLRRPKTPKEKSSPLVRLSFRLIERGSTAAPRRLR